MKRLKRSNKRLARHPAKRRPLRSWTGEMHKRIAERRADPHAFHSLPFPILY